MVFDRSRLRVYALLFGLALFAHFPGLWGGFTNWDDSSYVIENQRIQSPSLPNLAEIFNPALTWSDPFPEYAPVRELSLAIDCWVWGMNPFGFHLTNILLHALNTILVCLLLLRLFGIPRVALLTALLFACHPVHVESVAWVASRKDLLGLFFSLLSMIFFLKGEDEKKTKFWIYSIVAFVLAGLSKSQAVTVPAILGVVLFWRNREKLIRLLPHVLLTVLFIAHWVQLQYQGVPLEAQYKAGFEPNPLAILQTFARYGWHLLWPVNLSPYYDLNTELKQVNLAFFLSLAWLSVFISLVVYGFRRIPVIAISLLLFLLQLLPVLNFLPHPIWIADRYLYFASFFLLWPLSYLFVQAKERWPLMGRYAVVVLLALLSGLSWKQTLVWRNSETLWTSVLQQYPNTWVAHLNLGEFYLQERQWDEAEAILKRSLERAPEDPKFLANMGALWVGKKEYAKALPYLKRSLKKDPKGVNALYTAGSAYHALGNYSEAGKMYKVCLQINPRNANCNARMGNLLAKRGDFVGAKSYLDRSIQSNPDHLLALYDLAILLAKDGEMSRAKSLLRQILRLDSTHQEAGETLRLIENGTP